MPKILQALTALLGGAALLGSLGCDSQARLAQAPTAAPPAEAPAPTPSAPPPRLVVALVFDQLGSDTLLEHLPLLDPRGAIRQAISRGAFFEKGVYPYAKTVTAPGHAAIHTGTPPSVNGIGGNSDWDAQRSVSVASCNDPPHLVFGREQEGISVGPARLRVATVAHALKSQTAGAARVLSLSLKDRSATFSVGSAADLVLWYDTKLGAFTSSSAWGAALPTWVARYQAEHPISALLTPWLPLAADAYQRHLGPDQAPGEGDLDGFGTTFPHGWERVTDRWSVLRCTPMLSQHLIDLADAAITAHGLGRDGVPDLLALSISGTDCTGHVFGPDSWEYVDHLVRADRALGEWLLRLEQTTPLAVLITSDHGVAALPERRAGKAGRLFPRRIQQHVEAALVAELGPGPWVMGVMSPYMFLTSRARQHPEASQILRHALGALRNQPGLRDAWPLSEVRRWHHDPDPVRRGMALSVTPQASADLMFLPLPYYTLDIGNPTAKGTNHGTPYSYDREVPVLAWGNKVPLLRQSEPVDQLRVAATLSALLGVAPPEQAARPPLF